MSLRNIFRRKPVNDEASRRAYLLERGRIAEGTIFDHTTDESGNITHVFYHYAAGGVVYESSEMLDAEQQRRAPIEYTHGYRVTIRYDPRQPGNSIVV